MVTAVAHKSSTQQVKIDIGCLFILSRLYVDNIITNLHPHGHPEHYLIAGNFRTLMLFGKSWIVHALDLRDALFLGAVTDRLMNWI